MIKPDDSNYHTDLKMKVERLFWDTNTEYKEKYVSNILNNPLDAFKQKHLLIKVLTGLKWYELSRLVSHSELYDLLTPDVLRTLFPKSIGLYYQDAKRLLSKYSLS
jgi:hypothetical protein